MRNACGCDQVSETARIAEVDWRVFWQKRYYDFNVRTHDQFVEKLRYIHRNPVKKELCVRPEDWEWSSFRHYATGSDGPVEIESEWTARKREQALCSPLNPTPGLSGPPVCSSHFCEIPHLKIEMWGTQILNLDLGRWALYCSRTLMTMEA